ncbi:o-succinylbenzoate synthase [Pigmentibacter sp. JX0631]|uniref:o-succinylbenzoate synthase n=1 Tax=Pigmentibacter sp. JX0631 TaxID=2976982 RepID=UPI00246919B6|nr:o-succinylbenzoate synthase [Pigmentibacter sp. JX0631]WGL60075.1 o-succinylbenzoate synthase [Pigmentibacter sp. JX0631]
MNNILKIKNIEIFKVSIPLLRPFVTSFGSLVQRNIILVKLIDSDGNFGIGEAPVLDYPVYKSEFFSSAYCVLNEIILPFLVGKSFSSPEELDKSLNFIKGNNFAKASLSIAAYDYFAKINKKSLAKFLGAEKNIVTVSNTISIHEQISAMLNESNSYKDIKTLKLKIKPGNDIHFVAALRNAFPNAQIMVDANASYPYNKETIEIFKKMEEYSIFCIEQPLAHNDIVEHAKLQKKLNIPIALDESIESCEDLIKAYELGSCQMVNIKIPRVGGLSESIKIHNYCLKEKIPAWVGGMVESPVGISANLAFSALPGCNYPVDFLDSFWLIDNFYKYFCKHPIEKKLDKASLYFFGSGISENINLNCLHSSLI